VVGPVVVLVAGMVVEVVVVVVGGGGSAQSPAGELVAPMFAVHVFAVAAVPVPVLSS
jgi:hypothetical protein